jgi:hypothetical protein
MPLTIVTGFQGSRVIELVVHAKTRVAVAIGKWRIKLGIQCLNAGADGVVFEPVVCIQLAQELAVAA